MITQIKVSGSERVRVGADGAAEAAAVRSALEAEGFRFLPDVQGAAVLTEPARFAVVTGPQWRRGDWPERVEAGASVVLVHPDPQDADRLGLRDYQGEREETTLWPSVGAGRQADGLLVRGAVSVYGGCSGRVWAHFGFEQPLAMRVPGLVHVRIGKGCVLMLLFSLAGFIRHSRQRSPAAGQSGCGSAERIVQADTPCRFLFQPQVDMVMAFLSRYITAEMTRQDCPPPRFARLPGGAHSLVTISFDDLCPTGKPVRRAVHDALYPGEDGRTGFARTLHAARGWSSAVREALRFPHNHEEDVRRMIDVFARHRCRASAFIMPFVGAVRNCPRLTGYGGFSPRLYAAMRAGGWDLGTHIKPGSLDDYRRVHAAFCRHFGEAPQGHRGHELGWVGWDADWRTLADLGYSYDSTWNWGGHAGLAWPLGTSYPFHPISAEGESLSVLEMPLQGWIEDLVWRTADPVDVVAAALLRQPGVYHFGAHSWRLRTPAYKDLIESILSVGRRLPAVALGPNLQDIASFWRRRERSRLSDVAWNRAARRLSYEVESYGEGEELAVSVPLRWRGLDVAAAYAGGTRLPFAARDVDGIPHAVIPHPAGEARAEVRYA